MHVGAQQLKAGSRAAGTGARRGARGLQVHLTPPRGIVHGGLSPSVERVKAPKPVAVQRRTHGPPRKFLMLSSNTELQRRCMECCNSTGIHGMLQAVRAQVREFPGKPRHAVKYLKEKFSQRPRFENARCTRGPKTKQDSQMALACLLWSFQLQSLVRQPFGPRHE